MKKDNSEAHWIGGYELPLVKNKKEVDIWDADGKLKDEFRSDEDYYQHDGKGLVLGIMIILIGSILFWGAVFYYLIFRL